ncbi:formyltransferase family protein [Candidatus Odyssella acanthamoebae]|uniref:Methionyl-tRNA formyltransferase n=1 Tax=Candidatus Odyssella acanthamoebae TaxID=91604 RepID=A0A077AWS5_9PROT|nr:formyltransferase family protein [Candidatus Paracaedibacter acanthamoebae]AIK96936.1 methionyl-tRNA formyltransferase [Candidatus Paracaedibacter acanthamoebae]
MRNNYVIATIKDWHIDEYNRRKETDFKDWTFINHPDDLTIELLTKLNPKYIFFPHWSWIVPSEIVNTFTCVCFHSSDVPYGRGGSPIQNLIIRGHIDTKISALKMVEEVDAGPVYMKTPLSLNGNAQEIFENSAKVIADMMIEIVKNNPDPIPQLGEATVFKRRKESDNAIATDKNLAHVYNQIRMLDADSYPKAFINYGNLHLEFTDSQLEGEELIAKVRITQKS